MLSRNISSCFRKSDEQTSANNLCEDVLIEIFKHLDDESLRNAALVCRNWNQVIGTASETMEKFKITLSFLTFSNGEKSFRNHNNVRISARGDLEASLQAAARCDVSHARSLTIFGNGEVDCSVLMNLLTSMPLLESLAVDEIRVTMPSENLKAVNLLKLKKIIIGVNTEVLKLINVTKITELDIKSNSNSRFGSQALVEYLSAQEKLKAFSLDGKLFKDLFLRREPLPDFKFRLASLKVTEETEINHGDASNMKVNLTNFLSSQASTLRNLDLRRFYGLCGSSVRVIFNDCNKLRYLSLYARRFPEDGRLYSRIKSLPTVRALSIHNFVSSEAARGVLRKFPKILQLTMTVCGQEINFIPTLNSHLDQLVIGSLVGSMTQDGIFKRLKTLKVSRFERISELMELANRCPQLRDLTFDIENQRSLGIGEAVSSTVSVFAYLVNRESLRKIRIEGSIDLLGFIYSEIQMIYGRASSFSLRFENNSTLLFKLAGKPSKRDLREQSCRLSRKLKMY